MVPPRANLMNVAFKVVNQKLRESAECLPLHRLRWRRP
jgi:hypothetical protein